MTLLLLARYYSCMYIEEPRGKSWGIGDITEVRKTNGCPKCKKGNIVLDRDHYGWYEYCIQCGYVRDLIHIVESEQQQVSGVRKKREKD